LHQPPCFLIARPTTLVPTTPIRLELVRGLPNLVLALQ